jgi:hypothetical protein
MQQGDLSMPTWLDQWCVGMRHRRRDQLAEIGRPADQYCRHDGLAAREFVFEACREATHHEELHEDVPLRIVLLSIFAPFFMAADPQPFVRSFQLTANLADEVADVIPTSVSVTETRALMSREQTTIYIDVPSGVIGVGPAAELRAIFIEPCVIDLYEPGPNGETEEAVLRFCAIVTPRGRIGCRHVIWQDDRSVVVADNFRFQDGSAVECAMPTFDECLKQAGLATERFLDEVERVAYLTLERARNPDLAVVDRVPFLPADHPRRAPGRDGEVRKMFSLFKVERLNRRARPITDPQLNDIPRRQWQLGRRITVRAFWRQQPVGPRGQGLRRLTLVREHQKGPVGGLPIHPMQELAP